MPKPIDTDEIRYELSIGKMLSYENLLAMLDEIDRLRGEQQTPPQGKTVRVRIPVSVSPEGDWMSRGGSDFNDHQAISRCAHSPATDVIYWLAATLPVPAEVCVVARVEGE